MKYFSDSWEHETHFERQHAVSVFDVVYVEEICEAVIKKLDETIPTHTHIQEDLQRTSFMEIKQNLKICQQHN